MKDPNPPASLPNTSPNLSHSKELRKKPELDPVALAKEFMETPFEAPNADHLLRLFESIESANPAELRSLAGSSIALLASDHLRISAKRSLYDCYVLLLVRRAALYKAVGTFEKYCENSNISDQTARNCIRRAEVGLVILRNSPHVALPEKVVTVTALSKLPESHISECWEQVLAQAKGLRPSDNHARKVIAAYCRDHGLIQESEAALQTDSIECFDRFLPDEVVSLFSEKHDGQSVARHILHAIGRYTAETASRDEVLQAVEELRKTNREEYEELVVALMGLLFGSMAKAMAGATSAYRSSGSE